VNPFVEIKNAALGWVDLIGNRPGGGERFSGTRGGLLIMLGFYFALVLVIRVIQSLAQFGSFPRIENMVIAIMLNALPMLAMALVIFVTVRFLRPAVGMLGLLVPAGYALGFLLAISLPLSLFPGNATSFALQGVLGYMLYRLGRETGKFSIGVSIGFAVLSVVLLVAIPLGLYMLLTPDLPTPD